MNSVSIHFLVLLVLGLISFRGNTQVYTDTLTKEEAVALQKRIDKELHKIEKKTRFQVLPSVYYTPETRMAFGAVGILSFKFDPNDSLLQVSKISPSFIYTQNKQVLSLISFDLYPHRKWRIFGDMGYFIYPYFFSGVGNDHSISYYEWYDATYPKLNVNAYRKVISDSISVGLRYDFQKSDIVPKENGILESGDYHGKNGSTQSSIGLGVRYDSRSHIWSSTSGWYADFSVMFSEEAIGATYSDQFYTLDVRKYFSISKRKAVLALQFYGEMHSGNVPFNLMALLGGSEQMRGYRKGVFRDRTMLVYQAEYRSRLFFKYFTFALFANSGGIGNSFEEVQANYKFTAGGGLRYTPLPKERLFIRFDYAWGDQTEGFYMAIGEAF